MGRKSYKFCAEDCKFLRKSMEYEKGVIQDYCRLFFQDLDRTDDEKALIYRCNLCKESVNIKVQDGLVKEGSRSVKNNWF